MSRNRIIYNVLALYSAPTGGGSVNQLTRVQSFDEDFARNLTNVDQYGNLAAIDRLELEAPTVNSSFSYLLTDGSNENYLGLKVATNGGAAESCVANYLQRIDDQKNYFLKICDEGFDANNPVSGVGAGAIGLGNGFLTSYEVDAAVGELPKATVQLEALNVRVYGDATTSIASPGVNASNGSPVTGVNYTLPDGQSNDNVDQISALQPGDLSLAISGLIGVNNDDLKIQSFKLTVPLSREPIRRLGNKFAFTREIQFPVTATFSIEAELGDLEAGNLADILCTNPKHDITVSMRRPNCEGTGAQAMAFEFRGARLINQSVSTSIGDNATFSAEFDAQISAAGDNANGVFIYGSY